MTDSTFRDRFLTAFERSDMTVAELARRSGVNYHTIDKLKKGVTLTTSADTARKLSLALNMDSNEDQRGNRLLAIFYGLDDRGAACCLRWPKPCRRRLFRSASIFVLTLEFLLG